MAVRRRRVDIGAERGRDLVALTGRELMAARMNAGLSQEEVAAAAGISRSQYGRIELGLSPDLSIAMAARLSAVLGLQASLRYFPISDPIRDAAQRALLERLHVRCHASLRWRTEVPLPSPGDQRAWDAIVDGFTPKQVRGGIEAETRPVDVQALERKLALKQRDGDVEWMILLLADTRHNRAFLHGPGESLKARFPLDGRRAVELLKVGVSPGANAIVLL